MVTSSKTLQKIKEIIEKHYARLAFGFLGRSVLTDQEIAELKAAGVDVSDKDSILAMIYYHNFINNPLGSTSPTTLEGMEKQQAKLGLKPEGDANDYSIQNLNEKVKQNIDKLKLDVQTKIDGIIRQNNDNYKFNALQNMDRSDIADALVKESSLGKVKQLLRDTSGQANRDWQRVALTEMSNAIGLGSVDRIVTNNRGADLEEIYVYRIPVNDAVTCKYCKKFYNDPDLVPKLYRLSTLLANGSNYGKKPDTWEPVVGATHPNTRTSQIIELKPGFKLLSGGSVTYIGLEKWQEYIFEKLTA